MVKVTGIEAGATLTISKKLGYPWGFGKIWFGVSRFGDDLEESGIYQRRQTQKGQIFVRENFYWPVDTITPPRLVVRAKFAEGVTAWQALSEPEKDYYRALQYPENMSGYNRYLSLWLNS